VTGCDVLIYGQNWDASSDLVAHGRITSRICNASNEYPGRPLVVRMYWDKPYKASGHCNVYVSSLDVGWPKAIISVHPTGECNSGTYLDVHVWPSLVALAVLVAVAAVTTVILRRWRS
jgi:hypothetical protein